MIRKRALLSDICEMKRRKLNTYGESNSVKDVPTNTDSALQFLASIFPVDKFERRLPPIVMRHQIYAFVKSRTEVDKHLNELRKKNEIRLFKIGQNDDDQIAVVYLKDYKEHVEKCCSNNEAVANFMNVVYDCPDISFSRNVLLKDYFLREENITELIQQGVLCARDVGSYWLSIPRVGEFVKTFLYGRRATLQYVRRTKYKEILQSELVQRKLPRKCLLGILYHVYDIIGNELVTRIESPTGAVLRLQPELLQNR
ncbi:inactive serine/threonine-protein kinase 19 [Parasteatoda tepidariorum]|nr:serine/threonine-protein kinase 19 [Parasteatoda tepidariorum]XP_015922404.1 serine/threonine-protein kinase 19 [Parasteatoda tepidariorum]XP_015922406.1 serine/threonine-protein kinase 19 [Parasteatoda tepidariorum]XP_015922407.1 serine/threonine-protein kinase 19 [Parasteatoda tepidariorum]